MFDLIRVRRPAWQLLESPPSHPAIHRMEREAAAAVQEEEARSDASGRSGLFRAARPPPACRSPAGAFTNCPTVVASEPAPRTNSVLVTLGEPRDA